MGHAVVGIEPGDPADAVEPMRRVYGAEYLRRFCYGGPADDRDVNVMSERVDQQSRLVRREFRRASPRISPVGRSRVHPPRREDATPATGRSLRM